MKFNKWTDGLAAVGAVSLVSAARADEVKLSPLNTALSATTISGYVDVAAQYNNGNQGTGNVFSADNKVDAFTVNSVTVSLDKPEDESPWASGYHVDLNAGVNRIDAFGNTTSTDSHFAIRQAYVALRTPVGNGIDWKLGAWDTILGYESSTGYANPNYTRSLGYGIEPTSYVGLLGTYKVADWLTVNGGIANPVAASFAGGFGGLSSKNFLGSVVLTAPDSFGVLKGATLTAGTSQTFQSGGYNNYYAGVTLPTPIKALALGFAFDSMQALGTATGGSGYTFGVYGTYQATDKVALALRGEYVTTSSGAFSTGLGTLIDGEEITATLSYNLWANVVSRVEARWDHNEHSPTTGLGNTPYENAFLVALNIVYKF